MAKLKRAYVRLMGDFSQLVRRFVLTLLLLNTTCPVLANSVDHYQFKIISQSETWL